VAAHTAHWPQWLAILLAAGLASGLRTAAILLDWRLPAWRAAAPRD
jgi:hypothetical protein